MILDADAEDADRAGELTLVFSLAAARALADPAAAFEDAREWSRYVGIVANDVDAVDEFVREHDLEQDYALGDRDKWLAMADVRETTETPRYVFVGTTPEDRRIADQVGWEFLTPREAAEKASWELTEGTARDGENGGGTGLTDRLTDRLADSDLWPF